MLPKSREIIRILYTAQRAYRGALHTLFSNFYWLLGFDIACTIMFYEAIEVSAIMLMHPSEAAPALGFVISLLLNVMWFLLYGIFLLAIRTDDRRFKGKYYQEGLVMFVQPYFVFSFLILVATLILGSMGIHTYPPLPWPVGFVSRILGLFILFYWLETEGYMRDLFASVERGTNLMCYNITYVLIIGGLWIAAGYGQTLLCQYFVAPSQVSFGDMVSKTSYMIFFTGGTQTMSDIKLLVLRYAKLIIDCMFIACLFGLYNLKKSVLYTDNIFK